MSKLTLTKKIKLIDVLGEGHEEDYLLFQPLTFKDAKELGSFGQVEGDDSKALEQAEQAMNFIKTKFKGGKIKDDATGEVVDVEPEDFDELPMSVVNHAMRELSGAQPEGFTTA